MSNKWMFALTVSDTETYGGDFVKRPPTFR